MIREFRSAMGPFDEQQGLEATSWHGAGEKVPRAEADRIDKENKRRAFWDDWHAKRQAAIKAASE